MRLTSACLVMIAIGASACGDDAGGGTGGGAATADPVLGTTHEGACETWADFTDACAAEGGTIADYCQGVSCQQHGTCYAPPPAPQANEFTCDGLFNCAVGTVCVSYNPLADGCFDHRCDPVPSACAADATCACLEENDDSITSCTADPAGNITLQTQLTPG
jgi:hypothetical protein